LAWTKRQDFKGVKILEKGNKNYFNFKKKACQLIDLEKELKGVLNKYCLKILPRGSSMCLDIDGT
jgi:hypothetical protein